MQCNLSSLLGSKIVFLARLTVLRCHARVARSTFSLIRTHSSHSLSTKLSSFENSRAFCHESILVQDFILGSPELLKIPPCSNAMCVGQF